MLANRVARARNAAVAGGLLMWSAAATAAFELNMPQGVTPISHQVYDLHMIIFVICVIIGAGVFGAMFLSIYLHRKSRGAKAAQFHESTVVEVIWTIIPMLILIAMAIPATKVLVAMEDTRNPDITIKVTGYQWKWQYDYLDEGISFFSNLATPRQQILNADAKNEHYLREVDNPMVVPVGKKIRILTTSADVLHSWWVPELGWKRDTIPGFVNENWVVVEEPGVYRGQCAELCGKDHAFMPIVVVAKTEEDYQQWMADIKAAQAAEKEAMERDLTMEELMAQGEDVYQANCAACHQAGGEGVPGVFPPLVAGREFSASEQMLQPMRERGFLSEDNKIVMGSIKEHIDVVLNGIPGTAMAAFGPQLNDAELAAVITYERNAWGNKTGDVIQPKVIKAQR